jgi:2'-5' RNA ligase
VGVAGSPVAPRATDSLFFAVYPDGAAAQRIARLAERLRVEHRLAGKSFGAARFHVTLHHLGSHAGLPPALVGAASRAAATIALPPFEVVFDRVASFPRKVRLPFVLKGPGAAGLVALQQAVGEALRGAGIAISAERAYTPHLTLLYDDRRVAEQPVEPIGWTVHELVLVRSLLGRSQHLPLGRWPLPRAE